jgi:endoglucanase
LILCLADRLTPREDYWQGALDQLHVILERNPLSRCYVTGFGSRPPQHPYHLFSMTDKVEEPVPGLLVAGPNQVLGDNALKRTFLPESAPATIYLDSEESISSNETDLTWNAVLAFVTVYVSQQSQ